MFIFPSESELWISIISIFVFYREVRWGKKTRKKRGKENSKFPVQENDALFSVIHSFTKSNVCSVVDTEKETQESADTM